MVGTRLEERPRRNNDFERVTKCLMAGSVDIAPRGHCSDHRGECDQPRKLGPTHNRVYINECVYNMMGRVRTCTLNEMEHFATPEAV